MFAGVNMFLARLRLFLRRGLKWVLRRAKNIFTPKNINSITIIIISEGIQKRNQRQYSKRYLERCQRRVGVYFTVVSLYKNIHCRITFKLRQNTAKFVERVLLLSFQRENNRILWAAKTWSLASVKINCASAFARRRQTVYLHLAAGHGTTTGIISTIAHQFLEVLFSS